MTDTATPENTTTPALTVIPREHVSLITELHTQVQAMIANFNHMEARLFESRDKVDSFDFGPIVGLLQALTNEQVKTTLAVTELQAAVAGFEIKLQRTEAIATQAEATANQASSAAIEAVAKAEAPAA